MVHVKKAFQSIKEHRLHPVSAGKSHKMTRES